MSLDGLRAWIAEVERKLGMRTRVFLVLSVLAIGGAGAGIYLAIDARDSAVSEGDVQELQEELEAQIAAGGGGATAGAELAQLRAELDALREQITRSNGEGGDSGRGGSKGEDQGNGGSGAGSSDGANGGASTGGAGIDSERLRELLEQTKERNEELE